MFQNRYAASNNQRNFIRQRYSVFNVSSQVPLIERNFEMDGKYHQFIIILYMIIYLFSAICYFLEDTGIVNDFQVEMDDCNGEEMTAFDIKSKETEDDMEFDINYESSDEVEFDINEHERMIIEFNESEEDGEDHGSNEEETSEEETNEEESDEEIIVDRPFNNEQMPQIFGEFAPYFKNITELLFFFWTEKHHICMSDSFETLNDVVLIIIIFLYQLPKHMTN